MIKNHWKVKNAFIFHSIRFSSLFFIWTLFILVISYSNIRWIFNHWRLSVCRYVQMIHNLLQILTFPHILALYWFLQGGQFIFIILVFFPSFVLPCQVCFQVEVQLQLEQGIFLVLLFYLVQLISGDQFRFTVIGSLWYFPKDVHDFVHSGLFCCFFSRYCKAIHFPLLSDLNLMYINRRKIERFIRKDQLGNFFWQMESGELFILYGCF